MAVKSSDPIYFSVRNQNIQARDISAEAQSPAQTYLSDHVLESVLDELGEADPFSSKSGGERSQEISRVEDQVPATSETGSLSQLLGQLDQAVGLDIAKEPAPETSAKPAEPSQSRYLIFRVHQWQLAIPLDHVMEVGNIPSTTWVPQLPLWVRGITHIRGEIYTVVDTRSVFNLDITNATKEQMILTRTHVDDMRTVLVVDRVLGIRNFAEPDDMEVKPSLSPELDPFVRGLSQWQGQALIFFDLNHFLNSSKLHPWREIAVASSY